MAKESVVGGEKENLGDRGDEIMELDTPGVDADLLMGSIQHLFLPKKTPKTEHVNLFEIEQFIFQSITQSLSETIEESGVPGLSNVIATLQTWRDIQPQNPTETEGFVDKFTQLIQGDGTRTVPIYVRNQNAVMIFHKKNDSIRLETFRTTLPTAVVMGNRDDLFLDLPETSQMIQNQALLQSPGLIKMIHDLIVLDVGISIPKEHEAAEPFLVNDWLVGLLAPENIPDADGSADDEQRPLKSSLIRKKVRDKVTLHAYQESSKLFRRSGFWMAIKAVLQLSLEKHLGQSDTTKMFYKTLILDTLANVSEEYFNSRNTKPLDFDLLSQMKANLARRVLKIELISSTKDNVSPSADSVEGLKNKTLKRVLELLEQINFHMQNWFDSEVASKSDLTLPQRSNEEYKQDLQHSIPFLTTIHGRLQDLQRKLATQKNVNIPDDLQQSLKLQRYTTADLILTGARGLPKQNCHQLKIWLHDAETFLKSGLPNEPDYIKIFSVAQEYIKRALGFYKEDNPYGISQLVLCFLKTLEELDKRAILNYPLLQKYSSGINVKSFEYLLLPHLEDIHLLKKALDYFEDRNQKADIAECLLVHELSKESFPVKYFDTSSDLQNHLEVIQAKVEDGIKRKMKEAQEARQECNELERKINEIGECSCKYENQQITDKYGRNRTERRLVEKCTRCDLKMSLAKKAKSVTVFVKPLPKEDHLQKALIFEMYIPGKISILRDVLTILQAYLLQEPKCKAISEAKMKSWKEYDNLQNYFDQKSQPNPLSKNVNFRGTCSETSKETPDVRFCTDRRMIAENGMSCSYSIARGLEGPSSHTFSFKIESMENSKRYMNLQHYLSSFTHSQNEVICNQDDCHSDLTLEEFLAYGSTRAGHRIQLRNLFRNISSNLLSLEEEPVIALILQTIWQIGPAEETDCGTHEDFFENDAFCQEFMNLLNGVVEKNKSNYARPGFFFGAVAIAIRIMELNERVFEMGFQMLRNWRQFIKMWTEKIEMKMKEANADVKELEVTLLIVNICSAFSYSFSSGKKWSYVMKNQEDVLRWLHTLHLLHQKAPDHTQSLSKFMQVLLTYVQSIPLKLRLENEVGNNPMVQNALIKFVSERWAKARECEEEEVEMRYKYKRPDQRNLVQLKYVLKTDADDITYEISFDFVLGTFLVNGYPVSQLPLDVTLSKTFTRFFGENNSRIVMQPESNSVFRTVREFHGNHYEFWTLTEEDPQLNSKVVIIEIREDLSKRVLLEPESFEDMIQKNFVKCYTQWLDLSEDVVHFQKLCSNDGDYELEPEYQLIRNSSNTWHFRELKENSDLLSIKSDGFKNIATYLTRLELPSYINVLCKEVEPEKLQLKVCLPRFKLSFEVSDNRLQSIDYPGFLIAREPDGKTLTGLQHGLELKNGEKRVLLIPHGDIILGEGTYHHKTNLNLQKLHQPPYFKYEYDEVLRRLVGNKSKLPYLYLAALHAVTSLSSGQPDAFTGVTGTEMAMRILQSGFIWSSTPYDRSSLRILEYIRSLSSCGSLSEIIDWPKILPSMSAYDGFAILVDILIAKSNILPVLNGGKKQVLKKFGDKDLQLRGYWTHIKYYNQLARLDSLYESGMSRVRREILTIEDKRSFPDNFNKFCNIAHKRFIDLSNRKSPKFNRNSFPAFICDAFNYTVDVFSTSDKPSTTEILNMDIQTNWFWIYQLAKKPELAETFSLILSILTYRGAPVEQVLNLHYLSKFADVVRLPDIPETLPVLNEKVPLVGPADTEIEEKFKTILNASISRSVKLDYARGQEPGETTVDELVERKALEFKNLFIRTRPSTAEPGLGFENFGKLQEIKRLFNADAAFKEIGEQIDRWHREQTLRDFANKIEVALFDINRRLNFEKETATFKNIGTVSKVRTGGNPNDVFNSRTLTQLLSYSAIDKNLLSETNAILKRGYQEQINFEEEKANLEAQGKKIIANVEASIHDKIEAKILNLANLSPRLDPTTLLQHHLKTENPVDELINEEAEGLKQMFAALAVIWTKLKQLNRCIAYQSSGQISELEKELENMRDTEAWNYTEHPEWICLELELDIRIRRKQVEVARQMMQMPDVGNGVMQLNMGEGKTSVIVPMLCCVLGGREKLCRVTILASMLNMNYKILSFAIGGLLNKRVYVMPCRRDMKIDVETVNTMKQMYVECMKGNGVVLALPEHRLSFRLLAYDHLLKKNFELGRKLWEVENWQRDHVRDVMDESDELLYAKYQLIYTVGEQMGLDGNQLRWECCQKILRIVQKVSPAFRRKYGENKIEYNKDEYFDKRHQFTDIRLLDDSVYAEFVSIVADKLLEEFTLGRSQKPDVKKFLTQNVDDQRLLERVLGYFKEDKNQLNQILTYAGYLRRGILTLGLSKRWRVEYGVDSDKTFRLMAVPFRAKDFPAERTEFGHPELGILLTHLSYYYSGLTDKQLEDVVRFLKTRPSSESIYGSWMETLQKGSTSGHLKSLHGINLKDSVQRNDLFQMLRHHTLVINFWLSHKVFPRECKQFPSKLVMTPWDLCFERNRYRTTGFSGTNDSSILLPLQITQQDLPSLLETNKEMEETLLQPENKGYQHFNTGVTCKEILEAMTKDKLRVLIDAGALMLDLDNEQVATAWLELDLSLEGVLYFNKENDLTVKIRGGGRQRKNLDIPLELTPYQGSLEKIGVFLDDQHTRGTDLKFPTEWRAVVTIGARMRRDKLIQACMRMRNLGKGQSVTFYLSMEVFGKINQMIEEQFQSTSFFYEKPSNLEITTEAVLEWVKTNTNSFNDDGLLYWAIAGKKYAQRLAAEDIFNEVVKAANGEIDPEALSILASQCVDDEVTQLVDMYGKLTFTDTVVNFIPAWFNSSWNKLERLNKDREKFASAAKEKFEMIREGVVERCEERIPDKEHVCSCDGDMEEEEEKELELENETEPEEERNVERPAKTAPAPHHLHENVVRIVKTGKKIETQPGIQQLPDIFEKTSFSNELQPYAWSQEVFATTDFVSVIKDLNCTTDSFLRPLEYFIMVKSGTGRRRLSKITQVLFLSPFEVNELLPGFRKKESPVTLHMFAMRRAENQSLLWDMPKLVLPVGQKATVWKLSDISMSSILLSSGNLYFGCVDEQKIFAAFLCLALKKWSAEEEKAFEEKKITKSGFMLPGYEGRSDFYQDDSIILEGGGPISSFQTDPSELVRKILDCRHSTPALIALLCAS